MLFIGICFVMPLLSMAVGMPSTLKYYHDSVTEMMFAQDQIILTDTQNADGNTITTSAKDAERYCITTLERRRESGSEEVTIFGIVKTAAT